MYCVTTAGVLTPRGPSYDDVMQGVQITRNTGCHRAYFEHCSIVYRVLLCYYGRHVTMQAIDLSEALQLWDGVIAGVPGCQRACFDDYILSAGFSSTITISIDTGY